MSTAQTRRKAPTRDELHPLPLDVEIYRGKTLVKTVRLADPRIQYCKAIGSLDVGLTACLAEQVAGAKMEGGDA